MIGAAYNIPHSPHLESVKIPTKYIAVEDTSRDPNNNFINFTNFINVTTNVIHFKCTCNFLNTHCTHHMEYFEIINNFFLFYVCQSRENFGNTSEALTI